MPPRSRRLDVGAPSSQPADDARFTITLIQTTIGNADAKAGIVAAILTLYTGLLLPRLSGLASLGQLTTVDGVAIALAVATGFSAGVTGLELLAVLLPRIWTSSYSRYGFPHIASRHVEELAAAGLETDRLEAWAQAQVLARISMRKHKHLAVALKGFVATAFLGVVTALLLAFATRV